MSTKHTSFIPMAPDSLPQQRLYEVVTLPDVPKWLDQEHKYISLFWKTRLRPPHENLLVYSAWNGRGHRRITVLIIIILTHAVTVGYYGIIGWRTEVILGPGIGILWHMENVVDQMKGLLPFPWSKLFGSSIKYHDTDHFHWINNTGLLSVDEIEAIAREVW